MTEPHAHTPHLIDCHVLTLPRFDPVWVAEMRADLDAEPVNQHWMPGIDGDLAASRVAGFSAGSAPFVTSADPDDRIMPGTYAALLQALQDNPGAPFAWAGEQLTFEDLRPMPARFRHVWPGGYDPVLHVSRGTHVHGVKLYRREFVTPHLEKMLKVGRCCEFMLDLAIAKPWSNQSRNGPVTAELSAEHYRLNFEPVSQGTVQNWPVHVPMVGRLWRQHGYNGSKEFTPADFDRMAQVLGFETMDLMRNAVTRVCLAHA